ncbi:MAG: response regulator transcription factor [Sedimentisphaerales bacterium]|nr:response regulator transcription factor [Sedimentisphaerales bacterium]
MRILIADDHGIVREGLKSLIDKQASMEVIAEAEDGLAAVHLTKKLSPDIVIMDVSMPNLNGIEAAREILRNKPNTKIIILSMYTDKHIVKESLEAGALGYILKSNLLDELLKAIKTVQANERYLSPRITGIVIEDYINNKTADKARKQIKLTTRERHILQLIAEGKTIKEIARVINISPKTADANRRRIMNKLNIFNTAELTKYAIREGLTSLDF